MTGYESKKAMAQDKLKQWDTPSEAFNEWWNGEYDDSTNPFTKHSLAYWAFAGWQAALAQPAQEQDATMQSLKDLWRSVCDGVGKAAFAQPAQEPVAFINAEQRTFEWAKPTSWHTPTVVNLPKISLYTAPPQRPWVGLTDEEFQLIYDMGRTPTGMMEMVEAMLKEKNNG